MLSYHVLCDIRTVAIIFVSYAWQRNNMCFFVKVLFSADYPNTSFFLNSYESCDVLKNLWKEMSLVLMLLKTNFDFNVKQTRKKSVQHRCLFHS
jgi:hypothetical protein